MDRRTIHIVVLGETGAGASTLVKSLLGTKAAAVKWTSRGKDKNVEEFRVSRDNKDVVIFDTPGLFSVHRQDHETLQELADKTHGKVDLLVYCHSMNARVTEKDSEAIGYLSAVLRSRDTHGKTMSNVVYALTFANAVAESLEGETQLQGGNETDQTLTKENFRALHQEFCECLQELTQEVLENQQVVNAAQIAASIPVVPIGLQSVPIPGCDDWISNFWRVGWSRIETAGGPAFIDTSGMSRSQAEAASHTSDKNVHKKSRLHRVLVFFCSLLKGPYSGILVVVGGCFLGAVLHLLYRKWQAPISDSTESCSD